MTTHKRNAVGAALIGAMLFVGCATKTATPARLTGTWTVAAAGPGRLGMAKAPRTASALEVDAQECVPPDHFGPRFGAPCNSHETEGGAQAGMGGDPEPGLAPTPSEVRWFCEGRAVVRLVIERCADAQTYRITNLAVSMTGGQ
jgi:hypothetical protein